MLDRGPAPLKTGDGRGARIVAPFHLWRRRCSLLGASVEENYHV
jgi:hypothetical protein